MINLLTCDGRCKGSAMDYMHWKDNIFFERIDLSCFEICMFCVRKNDNFIVELESNPRIFDSYSN